MSTPRLAPGPMLKYAAGEAAAARLLSKAPQAIGKSLPTLRGAGRWFSNLGQRTLYSTTGWLPKMPATGAGRMERLGRIGFEGAKPMSDEATRAAATEAYKGKWFKPLRRSKEKWIAKETERMKAQQELMKHDYGSLPGVVKGMVRNPGHLMKTTWESSGPLEKGMAVGFTGMGVHDIVRDRKPGEEPRPAAMGRLAASTGLWFPLRGLSLAPQLATWMGSEALGARAGKAAGGLVNKPPATVPGATQGPTRISVPPNLR